MTVLNEAGEIWDDDYSPHISWQCDSCGHIEVHEPDYIMRDCVQVNDKHEQCGGSFVEIEKSPDGCSCGGDHPFNDPYN